MIKRAATIVAALFVSANLSYTILMPPTRTEIAEALRNTHLFRSLDETQLGLVMDALEIGTLEAGQVLYREGDPAWHFYILYSGKVELTRIRRHKERHLATLVAGDYFGEEALGRRGHRPATVTAAEETVLLRLETHVIEKLRRQIPTLTPNLRILASTHQLLQHVRLDWLGPDEVVYLLARKHVIFLFFALLPPLLLALLSFVVGLGLSMKVMPGTITPFLISGVGYLLSIGWAIWNLVDWGNDYNMVTGQRVVWLERVAGIYDSRQEAPLTTLLSVGVRTGQLGRLLNFGDVMVRTYTGTLALRRVEYPDQVASIVEDHWSRSKESSRRAEAVIIQRTIRTRLGLEGTPTDESDNKTYHEVNSEVQPGWLQEWIATIFHVRYERDGNVTYRKHWYILLRKVTWPIFWIAVITILFVLRLTDVITLLPKMIGITVCVAGVVAALLWLVYRYLDWHNDIYQITHDQIVDVEARPLGKEERRAAPLENILSIEYKRKGLIGLLLNFGTVTASVGASKFTFDDVYNPSSVQQDIFLRMNQRIEDRKQAEIASERERISDWITIYHQNINSPELSPQDSSDSANNSPDQSN